MLYIAKLRYIATICYVIYILYTYIYRYMCVCVVYACLFIHLLILTHVFIIIAYITLHIQISMYFSSHGRIATCEKYFGDVFKEGGRGDVMGGPMPGRAT